MNNPICRLLSFKVYNEKSSITKSYTDNKEFMIQMFAIDGEGKSYSIKVTNGKTTTRKQHMTPVPAKGVYTIKVFVKYKELLAEKTIKLIIN